jgi:hypothetical protein
LCAHGIAVFGAQPEVALCDGMIDDVQNEPEKSIDEIFPGSILMCQTAF